MTLSLSQQTLIRSTWDKVKTTDAPNRFYDQLFQNSSAAADVFKRMQIRRIFDEFDLNGDGQIQLNELQAGIKGSSNQEMNKDELLSLIQGVSGQDELNIEQFTQLLVQNPGVVKSYNVRDQGAKVFGMFDVVVALMNDINALVPVLKSVGARHVDYGVDSAYFPLVGKTLIQVLESSLGDEFTDEARAAWTALYDIASSSMISGLGGEELTTRQKQIVKSSWEIVSQSNTPENFYGRLFTIAPAAAALFKRAQITHIFNDFDTNKDGRMQWGELKAGLSRTYHVELNRDAVLDLIRKTTRGTNETLSVNDFQALAEAHPETIKDYNVKAQARRIFDMISVAVNLMDDNHALGPVLDTVGGRHASYGVEASQFASVGEALLWTIEREMGDKWNAELSDAWVQFYRSASNRMINAMGKQTSKL